MCGNVKEFSDAERSLGKRCLFFLTIFYPEIRLLGDDCEEVVETEDCGLEPCDRDLVTEDVVIETTTLQSEKAVPDSHNETGNIL